MRRAILAALSTVAGLTMLLSFKTRPVTGLATLPGPAAAAFAPAPTPATTKEPERGTGSSSGPSSTSTTTVAPSTRTVTGAAAQTRYGPVQVQVTITNGRITAVEAVEYPMQSPKDRQINARAVPRLDTEAVAADSAQIDMVSGATYTSRGYITSLQSALDQAGVA